MQEMSFQAPATPINENETSFCAIPAQVGESELERVMEDVPGKVNVIDGTMYRDLPDCAAKAGISIMWGQLYGDFFENNNFFCIGGTGGVTYPAAVPGDGITILSPDLSLWKFKEQDRQLKGGALEHLARPAPAPNWVFEYEWESNINRPTKGVQKINAFFTKVGTQGTVVEEAWLLVKHQDHDVAEEPSPVPLLLALIRRLADVPYFGLVLAWPLLMILDAVTRSNRFSGKVTKRNGPPLDPATPYLVVFFRGDLAQPYGYYWLRWHEKFYAPPQSVYHSAPPLPADKILRMMHGEL